MSEENTVETGILKDAVDALSAENDELRNTLDEIAKLCTEALDDIADGDTFLCQILTLTEKVY